MEDEGGAERHAHRWALTSNVEGCHWWRITAHCHCGAVLHQQNERNPEMDPHAWEMLEPTCDRCSEIAGGARPEHRHWVAAA